MRDHLRRYVGFECFQGKFLRIDHPISENALQSFGWLCRSKSRQAMMDGWMAPSGVMAITYVCAPAQFFG